MAPPVRKPHVSTSDLLTWPEAPSSDSSHLPLVSAPRSHQSSDGMSKALFGGQVTDKESQSLNKKANDVACVRKRKKINLDTARNHELMHELRISTPPTITITCTGPLKMHVKMMRSFLLFSFFHRMGIILGQISEQLKDP